MATPTIGAFEAFVYGVMGVPADSLPTNSPVLQFAFDMALDVVLTSLQCVPYQSTSMSIYELAVYNYGADTLINFAPDIPSAANPNYWANIRTQWGSYSFVSGVINFSSDQSTSQGMAVPEGLKQLMIGDLQNLKTPYGRAYLAIAQSAGYGPFGLT